MNDNKPTLDPNLIIERESEPAVEPCVRTIPFLGPEDGGHVDVYCGIGQALSLTMLTEEETTVGLLAIALPNSPVGVYIPMRAEHLRNFGASCIALANQLDGGKGKQ